MELKKIKLERPQLTFYRSRSYENFQNTIIINFTKNEYGGIKTIEQYFYRAALEYKSSIFEFSLLHSKIECKKLLVDFRKMPDLFYPFYCSLTHLLHYTNEARESLDKLYDSIMGVTLIIFAMKDEQSLFYNFPLDLMKIIVKNLKE